MRGTLRASKLLVAFGGFTFIACTAHTSTEPPKKPTTSAPAAKDEDRDKSIRITREMEADPLTEAPDQVASHQWLVNRMANDHGVTVLACPDLLGPGDHEDYPFHDQLLVLTLMGEYAFLLEHHESAPNDVHVFLAGLTSARRGYRSILKSKPESHWDNFERLETLDDAKIETYVRQAMDACSVTRSSAGSGS